MRYYIRWKFNLDLTNCPGLHASLKKAFRNGTHRSIFVFQHWWDLGGQCHKTYKRKNFQESVFSLPTSPKYLTSV